MKAVGSAHVQKRRRAWGLEENLAGPRERPERQPMCESFIEISPKHLASKVAVAMLRHPGNVTIQRSFDEAAVEFD